MPRLGGLMPVTRDYATPGSQFQHTAILQLSLLSRQSGAGQNDDIPPSRGNSGAASKRIGTLRGEEKKKQGTLKWCSVLQEESVS